MKVACKKECAAQNIGEVGREKFCKWGAMGAVWARTAVGNALAGLVALMRGQWNGMRNSLSVNGIANGVGLVRGLGVGSGVQVDGRGEGAGGGLPRGWGLNIRWVWVDADLRQRG